MTDAAERLEGLQAEQLRVHRLDPSRPMREASEMADFVRDRGVVVVSGRTDLPVLAEAIAGEAIEGTWWRHPEAHRIYDLLGRLPHGLVGGPFGDGKATLCVSSLGPAIERVASDAERRERARAELPDLARRLLDDVEREGSVRMDGWRGIPARRSRSARKRLERELLVVSEQFHTDRGYHTALVRPWAEGDVAKRFRSEAGGLDLNEAQEVLVLAGIEAAVVASEREVRRWFALGREPVDRLLASGRLERLREGRRSFVATPGVDRRSTG